MKTRFLLVATAILFSGLHLGAQQPGDDLAKQKLEQLEKRERRDYRVAEQAKREAQKAQEQVGTVKDGQTDLGKKTDVLKADQERQQAAIKGLALKEEQHRRIMMMLGISALVLGLCGVLIALRVLRGQRATRSANQELVNPDIPTLRKKARQGSLKIPYVLELKRDPAKPNATEEGTFSCHAVFQSANQTEKPRVLFAGESESIGWDRAVPHAAQLARQARQENEHGKAN